MILLKESLMQSSGTITPQTHASEFRALKGKDLSVGEGSINFNNLKSKTKERDAFLEKQFKSGHFKEFNKLFKQEEVTSGSMPGLVGPAI